VSYKKFLPEMKKLLLLIILHSQFLIPGTRYCLAQPYGWYPQNSGTTNNLNHVVAVSYGSILFAVGDNGAILKTTGGGNTWTSLPSGTNNHLRGISFYGSNTGYVAGNAGTVLRTTDQGSSWSMRITGTANHLHSIFGLGNILLAIGDNGTIVRSTNAGANWALIPSPTSNHLRSIVNAMTSVFWVVGNNGSILRSTDVGISWLSQSSPTSNNLNSINILSYDDSTLWIAGDNGTILRSTNNGSAWQVLNSGTSANLYGVTLSREYGSNSVYAWVCGANGLILKTTNGGVSWFPQNSGTSNTLNSIYFRDINNGWAVGSGGTILHTWTNTYVISSKKLDANNISTWFSNNGSFNYRYWLTNSGFEWPKGTALYARFASGMWIGARVGTDTLVAIADYSFEYRPGYTDNNGIPQGQNDPNYIIYKLTHGVNDSGRIYWPNALLGNSDQGAPVYFDNQTNSWRPLDFGSQTLFYRFTDSYPEAHTVPNGNTTPLRADLMRLDFSLDVPGGLADVAISQFTIINRGMNVWQNTYFTIWTDDDLGYFLDDRIGCDSALNLGYTYNGNPTDPEYGIPPAVGFLFLRGGLIYTGNNNDTVYVCRNKTRVPTVGYKDQRMSVFNWYDGSPDPENGNPWNARESYRYMSGDRRNGAPTINPLGGYRTRYMFSGDPVTNQGWVQNASADQRFMASTGPVNMNPGDTQVIVVAQLIARGTSNLNSITRLRELVPVVKSYYNSCYTNPPIGIEPVSSEVPLRFQLHQNFPNPFNSVTVIRYQLMLKGLVTLRIFDVLGREVSVLVNEEQMAGIYEVKWDATDFQSGVYFYKLTAGEFNESRRMILIK